MVGELGLKGKLVLWGENPECCFYALSYEKGIGAVVERKRKRDALPSQIAEGEQWFIDGREMELGCEIGGAEIGVVFSASFNPKRRMVRCEGEEHPLFAVDSSVELS